MGKSSILCLRCGRTMLYLLQQDAVQCPGCGMTVNGIMIITGKGRNEYWTTEADYRSASTGGSGTNAGNYTWKNYTTTTGTSASITTQTLSAIMQQYSQQLANSIYSTSVLYNDFNRPSMELEVVKETEPRRAWKTAKGIEFDGEWYFQPWNASIPYKLEDSAGCHKYAHRTPAPQENCACGFYGMKPEYASISDTGLSLELMDHTEERVGLEVEFYGKIVECEMGYRAQYQRVLGVYTDRVLEPRPPVDVFGMGMAVMKMMEARREWREKNANADK